MKLTRRQILWSAGLPWLSNAAPGPIFDIQGHRGARGLAPENTLAAFDTALALGVDTLELDLGLTRDGHLVVTHDLRLNPDIARDASGAWLAGPGPAIVDITLAEIQTYDVGRLRPGSRYAASYPFQVPADGERIPTLAEVFALVQAPGARHVRLNVETKLNPLQPDLCPEPDEFARVVVQAVRQAGMSDRVSVQSFDWRSLAEVRRLAPALPTVALTTRQPWLDNVADVRWTAGLALADHGGSVPRLVKASGAVAWSPFHGDLSRAELAEAQALGLGVLPWTVNDMDDIERLIDWGVAGLISDYPDRVRSALKRR